MSAFSGNIRKVLVIIAMEAEAAPLLAHLGLAEVAMEAANAPCKLHTGMVDGLSVSVVTNGKCSVHGVDLVGTSPAALTTFLAVNQVQPDLIINAGTAGGFKAKGAAIGDAFVSTNVRHHDRRIPIPGFTEYGIGSHVSTKCPNLVEVS
jgi:5'-methylthioadenosine nucleosidase